MSVLGLAGTLAMVVLTVLTAAGAWLASVSDVSPVLGGAVGLGIAFLLNRTLLRRVMAGRGEVE